MDVYLFQNKKEINITVLYNPYLRSLVPDGSSKKMPYLVQ